MEDGVLCVTTRMDGPMRVQQSFAVSSTYQHPVSDIVEQSYCFCHTTLIQLGAKTIPTLSGFFSPINHSVILDNIYCIGTENTLLECFYTIIGNHMCGQLLQDEPQNVIINCEGVWYLYIQGDQSRWVCYYVAFHMCNIS